MPVRDELLDALREVESGGDHSAVNPTSGARGAYQFMPATAERFGIDPLKATEDEQREAARKYLDLLLQRYDGDERLALMAYHAGEGNVDKWQRGQKSGVGPNTLSYPDKILSRIPTSTQVAGDLATFQQLVEAAPEESPLDRFARLTQAEEEPEEKEAPGFGKGIGDALRSIIAGQLGTVGDVISGVAPESAAALGAYARSYDPEVETPKIANIDSVAKAVDWAKYSMGQVVGYGGASLAVTLATAPLGPAAMIAANAALWAPVNYDSNLQRQKSEGAELNRLHAIGGAAAQTGLEIALGPTAKVIRSLAGAGLKGVSEEAMRSIAEEGSKAFLKQAGKEATKQSTIEAVEEYAQQQIERLQAGLDITSWEAFEEGAEAGAVGALGGLAFGPVGAKMSQAQARRELQRLEEGRVEEARRAEPEKAAEEEAERLIALPTQARQQTDVAEIPTNAPRPGSKGFQALPESPVYDERLSAPTGTALPSSFAFSPKSEIAPRVPPEDLELQERFGAVEAEIRRDELERSIRALTGQEPYTARPEPATLEAKPPVDYTEQIERAEAKFAEKEDVGRLAFPEVRAIIGRIEPGEAVAVPAVQAASGLDLKGARKLLDAYASEKILRKDKDGRYLVTKSPAREPSEMPPQRYPSRPSPEEAASGTIPEPDLEVQLPSQQKKPLETYPFRQSREVTGNIPPDVTGNMPAELSKGVTSLSYEKAAQLAQRPGLTTAKTLMDAGIAPDVPTAKAHLDDLVNSGNFKKKGPGIVLASKDVAHKPFRGQHKLITDLGKKLVGEGGEVRPARALKELNQLMYARAGGLAQGNLAIIQPYTTAEKATLRTIHESVHILQHIGKFTEKEGQVLLTPENQRALQKLAVKAWELKHPNWGELPLYEFVEILRDPAPLTGVTLGNAETIAYGAESLVYLRNQGFSDKAIRRVTGLEKTVMQKLKDLLRKIFGIPRGYDPLDILDRAVSGEMAQRPKGLGPAFGSLGIDENVQGISEEIVPSVPLLVRAGPDPVTTDVPLFMNWWNRNMNSLWHNAAVYKPLKPFAHAVKMTVNGARALREKYGGIVHNFMQARPQDQRAVEEWMEVLDNLGEKAQITENADGSRTIRWTPQDLQAPLSTGQTAGTLTLPTRLVPLWQDVRKAFDTYLDDLKGSLLARFDVKNLEELRSLDDLAAQGAAEVLGAMHAYPKHYIPHIRAQKGVKFEAHDKKGELRGSWAFDGVNARRAADATRRKLETQYDWDFTATHAIRAPDARIDEIGAVNTVIGLLNGAESEARVNDLLKELGRRKKDLAKKPFLRHRAFVPGFLNDQNRGQYLKGAIQQYFTRGVEQLADNYAEPYFATALKDLKAQPDLYNYAKQQYDYFRGPEGLPSRIKAAGYYWTLGGAIDSAMVNLFQNLHTTAPLLFAVGGNPLTVMKAAKDSYWSIKFKLPWQTAEEMVRLKENPRLPKDEREVLRWGEDQGIFSAVVNQELLGGFSTGPINRAFTSSELQKIEDTAGRAVARGANFLSAAFSGAESFNRMTAFLSAYRTFKNNPKAVKKFQNWLTETGQHTQETVPTDIRELSRAFVDETQYDMSREARARFMQGWGGTLFQFSTYPMLTLELIAKGLRASGGVDPSVGVKMLASMAVGLWSTAGIFGLPLVGAGADTLEWLSRTFGPAFGLDPVDLRKELQKAVVDLTGDLDIANAITKGPTRVYTHLALERRAGLDWPTADLVPGTPIEALGPAGAMIGGGLQNFVNYWNKGLHKLAIAQLFPRAFRSLVRTFEGHDIGLISPATGNVIIPPDMLDPHTAAGLARTTMSAFGFQTTDMADLVEASRWLRNDRINEVRQNIADRLGLIYGQAVRARRLGKDQQAEELREQLGKALQDIAEHDRLERDPRKRYVLDWKDFMRSLKTRAQRFQEGAVGQQALKGVRKDERGPAMQDIQKYVLGDQR